MRIKIGFICIISFFVLFTNCSKKSLRVNRKPLVHLLVENSDFEEEGSWQISAPMGYNKYAQIQIDDQMAHAGKKSGLVYLERMPGKANEMVIHAWMQTIVDPPKGIPILFGGWVSAWQGTVVRIAIEYELATPENGQTLFSKAIEIEAKDEHFTLLQDKLILPQNTIRVCFLAGIASTGEAHFDNLFAFVEPAKMQEKEFTTKQE